MSIDVPIIVKPEKLWVEIYSRNALINVFCFFLSTMPYFQFLTACWSSMHAKTTHTQRAISLTNDMTRD